MVSHFDSEIPIKLQKKCMDGAFLVIIEVQVKFWNFYSPKRTAYYLAPNFLTQKFYTVFSDPNF